MSPFCYPYPHPAVTTDVVVFSIIEQALQILLIQRAAEPFRHMWALPGGFLEMAEDLETCAKRELEEETGLSGVQLAQFHTFGKPDRDPRERVVSVAYYALVPASQLAPEAGSDAQQTRWFPLRALPDLAFDHASIIQLAHRCLSAKLANSNIAFQFLQETFTLDELQSVYEIMLDKRLDERNFRRRILAQNLILATDQAAQDGKHHPAKIYRARNPSESL
jgi:8-oxo-dGTP diphosphatase